MAALSPFQDDFDDVGLVAPHELHPFEKAGRPFPASSTAFDAGPIHVRMI
jgi:hypothetical protein